MSGSGKSQSALEQVSSGWWTAAREDRWEELDAAARAAVSQYREGTEGRIGVGHVCGACAPNTNGISSDTTPDEWYFSSPADKVSDPALLGALLNQELGEPITIRERTDEWADGYWFVVERDNE